MTKDLKDSSLFEERFKLKERKENMRFYCIVFLIIFAFLCLRTYWTNNFSIVQVSGSSMERTFDGTGMDYDCLLAKRVTDIKQLERGAVIVVTVKDIPEFKEENDRLLNDGIKENDDKITEFLIKRLIATEGEAVRCTNGQVQICKNYDPEHPEVGWWDLNEPYAYYQKGKQSYNFSTYVVGKGEVFFLGDNRQNSKDSRYKDGKPYEFSRLDRLYEAKYVTAYVPEWAIEHKTAIRKIFVWDWFPFYGELKNFFKK